jgi:hypothetical protein
MFFFAATAFASNETQKNLAREMDPIIVTGDQCPSLIEKPISLCGLYALQDNRIIPIPFQIDEKNKKGNFVLTAGKAKSLDDDKGMFDSNDQLVFMAKDTGDKILDKSILPKNTGVAEITITDPVTDQKSWVYLLSLENPGQHSAVDYVKYDPDQLKITATNYIIGYSKKYPAVPNNYTLRKSIGGDEINLLDKVKARIITKQVITIKMTEKDIVVKEKGYIDGPVRVIVHTVNKVPLFMGIPASITEQDTIYYYAFAEFPFVVDMPIRPSYINVKVINAFTGCKGWTFYSPISNAGHIIDGIPDKAEEDIEITPSMWAALSNDRSAIWARCISSPRCPIKVYRYHRDDIAAGELPGSGLDFREGWDKVKKFPVEFNLVHFFTKAYSPGDEKNIVNVHNHPLKIAVGSKE